MKKRLLVVGLFVGSLLMAGCGPAYYHYHDGYYYRVPRYHDRDDWHRHHRDHDRDHDRDHRDDWRH